MSGLVSFEVARTKVPGRIGRILILPPEGKPAGARCLRRVHVRKSTGQSFISPWLARMRPAGS